jgi:hypothetical protein
MNMASSSPVSVCPWHTTGFLSHLNIPPSKVPEINLAVGRAVVPAEAGNWVAAPPPAAEVVAAFVVVVDLVVVATVVDLVVVLDALVVFEVVVLDLAVVAAVPGTHCE